MTAAAHAMPDGATCGPDDLDEDLGPVSALGAHAPASAYDPERLHRIHAAPAAGKGGYSFDLGRGPHAMGGAFSFPVRRARVATAPPLVRAAWCRLDSGASPHAHEIGSAIWGSSRGAYLTDRKWLEHATACVDAALWDHLLDRSGLRSFLDANARQEWNEQIEKLNTPPLTPENGCSTGSRYL